jgi:hypothetical protein
MTGIAITGSLHPNKLPKISSDTEKVKMGNEKHGEKNEQQKGQLHVRIYRGYTREK